MMDSLLDWAWSLFDRWDTGPSLPLYVTGAAMFGPGDVLSVGIPPALFVVSWREGPVLYVRPEPR